MNYSNVRVGDEAWWDMLYRFSVQSAVCELKALAFSEILAGLQIPPQTSESQSAF